MTYDTPRPSGVSFDCSSSEPTGFADTDAKSLGLAAATGFGYTGRGRFYGSARVSVTCPAGRFQDTTRGSTQGAADGNYYTSERSADGQTVSYAFNGKVDGTSSDWYVSGSCVSTREPLPEVGDCRGAQVLATGAVYNAEVFCDDYDNGFTDVQALGNFPPGESGALTVLCGPGQTVSGAQAFSTERLSDVRTDDVPPNGFRVSARNGLNQVVRAGATLGCNA